MSNSPCDIYDSINCFELLLHQIRFLVALVRPLYRDSGQATTVIPDPFGLNGESTQADDDLSVFGLKKQQKSKYDIRRILCWLINSKISILIDGVKLTLTTDVFNHSKYNCTFTSSTVSSETYYLERHILGDMEKLVKLEGNPDVRLDFFVVFLVGVS